MNIKKIFIETIKDIINAFVKELEKMFKSAIENISVDADCITFYADIKKVFDEHPKDEKGRDLIDVLLEDYKKKVTPQRLQPILQRRGEKLNGKAASSLPKKGGGATESAAENMNKHRIIVEPDVLSQIKVPKVQLFNNDTYKSTVSAIATPIKVGIQTATCAVCGVKNIYVTVRKKILDMFEGNSNAILDTLFDIESPVFAMVKGHVQEILDKLEAPIMENFAAIMFDVKSGQLSQKTADLAAEKTRAEEIKREDKKREKEEEAKRISLQTDIDRRVKEAKAAQSEKDKAAAAKKRQCGGRGGGAKRRRRRRQQTYKWRRGRGGGCAKKTLRIKSYLRS